MSVIMNPGSGPVAEGNGWTNTYETALRTARQWLANIRADGIQDVELFHPGVPVESNENGRWRFEYRHQVTGVSVFLETHGVDDLGAYRRQNFFDPRVYWNGSSSSEPVLQDWAARGFEKVKTFRKAYQSSTEGA